MLSMTGFGSGEAQIGNLTLTVELRSVNHRYLELFVRLPEELRSLEPLVREHASKRLVRGKVDCSLRFVQGSGKDEALRVNTALAKRLLRASEELEGLLGTGARPKPWDLLRWPGVMESEPQDLTPMQERAAQLLDQALDSLVEARRREGGRAAVVAFGFGHGVEGVALILLAYSAASVAAAPWALRLPTSSWSLQTSSALWDPSLCSRACIPV